MNTTRRGFLRFFGLGAVALAVPTLALAKQEPIRFKTRYGTLVPDDYLVGYKDKISKLDAGYFYCPNIPLQFYK